MQPFISRGSLASGRRGHVQAAALTRRARRGALLERLEQRTLMSYTFSGGGTSTGTATGDAGADTLFIEPFTGLVYHSLDGVVFSPDWGGGMTIAASNANTINIDQGAGPNTHAVSLGGVLGGESGLKAQININGGGANDSVTVDDGAQSSVTTYSITAGSDTSTTGVNVQFAGTALGLGRTLVGGGVADVYNLTATVTGEPQTITGGATGSTFNASGISSDVILNGGSDSDTFHITPSANGSYTINGNDPAPPASPGDTLFVDPSDATGIALSDTLDGTGHSGTFTFTNSESVNYTTIETLVQPYVVTNTADSGIGSLRQAILNANAFAGKDTITFAIPGSGTHTIQPLTNYPDIVNPVIIDGSTQSGYMGTPLIEIDGSMDTDTAGAVFTFSADNSRINGLAINSIPSQFVAAIQLGGMNDVVQGNFIGTDVTGTTAKANADLALEVGGTGDLIGGTDPGDANVISANMMGGMVIGGDSNFVEGNFIGTDITGTVNLGNGGPGIFIGVAADNTIGGSIPADGNVIAFNQHDGLDVFGPKNGDEIRNNSIFANTGIGIDLNVDGVTPNDLGDGDTGPNDLQNFPVLTSAVSTVSGTTVAASLNSTASSSFLVDFYSNPTLDSGGTLQGAKLVGTTLVNTDTMGNATINALFPIVVPGGQYVTATATSAVTGSTSEFAAPVLASHINEHISPQGVTFSGSEGRLFSGTVASFTTNDFTAVASNYTANVYWGDGIVMAGAVVKDGTGAFHITAGHRYAEQSTSAGYPVFVTIHRILGATNTAASHAKIADSLLDTPVGLSLSKSVNTTLTNLTLGSFRDQDSLNKTPGDYTGTIDWGDGTAKSAAKFVFNGSTLDVGSFWKVQGTHKYTKKKTFTVTITVHDTAAVSLVIKATIKVG